jgi:hypothetical protein
VREFCAHLNLDISRELLQHVIEQRNLLARIAARTRHEQVGDALKYPQALFHTAGGNRADQFVDQRMVLCAHIAVVVREAGVGHGATLV